MKQLLAITYLLLAAAAHAATIELSTATPLTGAEADQAADKLVVIDGSAATVKPMTLAEAWKSWGGTNVSATELGYLDGVTSAIQTQLDAKQATLVSGTNLKTVNSTSLLGSGDIAITVDNAAVNAALEEDAEASRASMVADRASVGKFHVADYGAVPDGVTLYDGTYTIDQPGFTSATATFTNADVGKSIVLQLSQTSRQILTIASVTNATTIVMSGNASASSSDYNQRITTYGSDNSAEIQAAINAVAALGGGSIQFEGGIYLCTAAPSDTSNVNSIFAIPYEIDPRTAFPPTIEFIGVVPPLVSFFDPNQLPSTAGTIIYCPNPSVTGTDPSIFAVVRGGAEQDAITGSDPGATTYWGSVTTSTAFKNLTIRQYPNPKMHALQFRYGGRLTADDISIDLDVRYSSSTNPLSSPESGAARAIICPERLSGYGSNIEKAYAYGYYVGIEIGDLTEVGHFTAEFCWVCCTSRTSTNYLHANVLNSYRCREAIRGPLRIIIDNFNIESYKGGSDLGIEFIPSWTSQTAGKFDIDNYDGTIVGKINVCTVLAGFGRIPTTVRNPTTATTTLEVWDGHLGINTGTGNFGKIDVAKPITALAPILATAGTAGSTTYKYRVLYVMPGGAKVLSPEATIATGHATLDATNRITVTIQNVQGAATYWLYRTSSAGTPSSTGRITTGFIPASGVAVSDTGLAGDSTTPEETAGRMTAETAKLTGTAVDDSTSVLSRAENDARYGRRIYHELASDISNGVAGTTVDTNTVTLPVGKWLVRGAVFTTRNVTTSNCQGSLRWVSGGTTTGRVGRNTWHAATYNGDPFTFVTAGSFMDPGAFSVGGTAIIGGVGMDTAAGTSKVMRTCGEGWIEVTGSPAVLRFQVTQTTADAVNPAILKAGETYVEFTKKD